jgi:hypothetical protein
VLLDEMNDVRRWARARQEYAEKQGIKHVNLAIMEPDGPKHYKLSKEPGADFPQDERVVWQLLHRHLLPLAQGVVRRDDKHHPVAGEVAELQTGFIDLAAHQPETDLPALHLSHHPHAVADGGANADVRVLLAEGRQQGWEQVLAGDRTGGEEQFTGDRGFMAGYFPASLPVQVEYPLSVIVEFMARFGEHNSSPLPLEQGRVECLFEGLHTLAERRLRQLERLRRPGEAATRQPSRRSPDTAVAGLRVVRRPRQTSLTAAFATEDILSELVLDRPLDSFSSFLSMMSAG